jgi:predicted Zn-dependent protease
MTNPAPEVIAHEVSALLERRRIVQARARLKTALQEFPDHPDLLLQSAWTDYLADDNAAALATVRHLITRDPENQRVRLLLFKLLIETGKLAEAESVILDLLRQYPEHPPYYGRYAELMIHAMQLVKARALAQEGLKYDPDDANCLTALALCDFIEQPGAAAAHSLQQLLVRHPQSQRTLALVAFALNDRGDQKGAFRIAQELVRAQPDNPEFVRLAMELKAATHWTMLPLWPMMRWGWAASVGLWVTGIVAVQVMARINPAVAGILVIVIVLYAIYSWIWPPILRRWIARS